MAALTGGASISGGSSGGGKYDALLTIISENGFGFTTAVLPQPITITKANTFNAHDILNRASPLQTYGHGNPINVSISLFLLAISDATAEVVNPCNGFMSCLYTPDPGSAPPPLLNLTLGTGQFLDDWPCVLTNLSIGWCPDGQWAQGGVPKSATVGLTLLGIEESNLACSDWGGLKQFTQLNGTTQA